MLCSLVLISKSLKIRVMLGGGTCKNVMRCVRVVSGASDDPVSSLSRSFRAQEPHWCIYPVSPRFNCSANVSFPLVGLHSTWASL